MANTPFVSSDMGSRETPCRRYCVSEFIPKKQKGSWEAMSNTADTTRHLKPLADPGGKHVEERFRTLLERVDSYDKFGAIQRPGFSGLP